MASSTRNVKMGVCKITYKGVDLGYTKGGVEVDVTTQTHQITVDQFGESVIGERITKRDIKVAIPLAETTLENLVATMPGATLVTDGVKASGTITISTNPQANDTVVINGVTFTFKTSASGANEVSIGATAEITLNNLLTKLQNTQEAKVVEAQYEKTSATVITVTYDVAGVAGNAFTLAKTGTGVTVSGATLTNGADATKSRVDVVNAVGTDLLAIAGLLVLHPQDLPDGDKSEDLRIPFAATAGAMKFAYKHNEERVFNTEFTGYPDPDTKILFQIGDETAVAP